MKFLSVITFSLLSATLLLNSCAKVEEESFLEVSKTSWLLWMDDYRKGNDKIKPVGDDGLFVEVIKEAPTDAPGIEVGNWVRINYTGRSIQGNVYVTRDKEIAEQQGTSTVYTNYVPQYVLITESATYSGMPYGQYIALRNMKQGEKIRAYMPSYIAYGSSGTSFSKGYQGQNNLGSNVNIMVDIELVEVIKDITKHEEDAVKDMAFNKWGWTDKDTVTTKNILAIRYDTVGFVEVEPLRDSITVDSTVKIYYKGMFLNGFVFDTNIDSVAQRVWKDFETKKVLTYKPKDGGLIPAFADVVPTMVYNEWAKMIFTSTYGYGQAGSSEGKTIIQPYSPLIFEFYIPTNLPYKKK